MAEVIFEQRSFNKGEVSPSFLGRSDLVAYKQGLKNAQNAFVSETGSICKRPGLQHVDNLPGSGRIIPFSFSNDENYILAFTEDNIAIYQNDRFLVNAIGVTPPWDVQDILDISYTQSADVLFLVHPNYIPHKLIRKSNEVWELEQDLFDYWDYATNAATWGDGTMASVVTGIEGNIILSATPNNYREDAGASIIVSSAIVVTVPSASSAVVNIALSVSFRGTYRSPPSFGAATTTIPAGMTSSTPITLSATTGPKSMFSDVITVNAESDSFSKNPSPANIQISIRSRAGPR